MNALHVQDGLAGILGISSRIWARINVFHTHLLKVFCIPLTVLLDAARGARAKNPLGEVLIILCGMFVPCKFEI